MYPVTDVGRVLAIVLIVVMLIEVPIQIAKLSAYFEEDSQLDEVQRDVQRLARDLRDRLGIEPPGDTDDDVLTSSEMVERLKRRLGSTGKKKLRSLVVAAGLTPQTSQTAMASELVEMMFGVQIGDVVRARRSSVAAMNATESATKGHHHHSHAPHMPGMLGSIEAARDAGHR